MSDQPDSSGEELKRVPVLLPGDVTSPVSLPGMDTGIKEAKLLGRNLSSDEIAAKAANSEYNRNETFPITSRGLLSAASGSSLQSFS